MQPGSKASQVKVKAKAKALLIALGIGFFASCSSIALYWNALQFRERQYLERFEIFITGLADGIDAQFNERYADVLTLASSLKSLPPRSAATRNLLNRYVELYPVYDLILVVDQEGHYLNSSSKDQNGRPVRLDLVSRSRFGKDEWFNNILSKRFIDNSQLKLTGVSVSNLGFDPITALAYGEHRFGNSLSAPILDDHKNLVGVISCRTNFSWIGNPIRMLYKRLSETGLNSAQILVTDSTGRILADFDPVRYGDKFQLKNGKGLGSVDQLFAETTELTAGLSSGKTGVFPARMKNTSVTQVVAFTPVIAATTAGSLDWRIVGRVDSSELLSTVTLAKRQFLIGAPFLILSILGALAIVFISSRREAAYEEQLLKATHDAQAANIAKSEFLANISHEIRTPMNAIAGMTSLLENTPLTAEQKRYVDICQRSGDSLLKVLSDVLDLSKIESGQMTLAKTDFDLLAASEDILGILGLRAAEKNIEFSLDYHDDKVQRHFIGDPLRIRQVFHNLVSNALKFTDKGEVKIVVRENSSNRPGNILVTVSDTGSGIPNDKIDLLFQPFSQIDSSFTRKFGGTGLGLVICRKLVEAMGGRIWVESEPGKGSLFHFTLDLKESKLAQAGSSSAVIPALEGLHAVVVDDRPVNQSALKRILEPLGLIVHEAGSSDAALSLTEGLATHFVLLDHRTGSTIDCIQLVKDLRVKPAKALNPAIVFITFDNPQAKLSEARAAGVTKFIYKPVIRSELRKVLTSCRDEKQRQTQIREKAKDARLNIIRPGLKILLVDDSEDNRILVNAYLEASGNKITEAENGQSAFDKFKKEKFDLVFMDIQMPVMDGLQATRLMRSWERENHLAPTPIVALTAHTRPEDEKSCLEAGCVFHLPKPISQQKLLEVLALFTRSGNCPESATPSASPLSL